MQSRFGILFQVDLVHEYFRDGNSVESPTQLFECRPTADTEQQMRDLGLLLRPNKGGFTILYRCIDANQVQQSFIQDPDSLHLRFYLHPLDPSFYYYSDLSIDAPKDSCVYLSNKIDNQQLLDGNNQLLLSADTSAAFVGGQDQVSLTSAHFPYAFTSAADTALLSVRDQTGNIHYSTTLTKLEEAQGNNPNPFETYLKLTGLAPGQYSLYVEDQQLEQIYLEPEPFNQKPFAIIEIGAGGQLSNAYQFVDGQGLVTAKTYQIRFNRRETIWKYLIGLKHNTAVNEADLAVVSSNFSATFTRQTSIQLADDTKAVPFESDPTLIPLLHKPLKGFSLQRTLPGPGPSSTEAIPLPTPKVNHLAEANGKIYSEVYVYI